jgi:hypothetical protein
VNASRVVRRLARPLGLEESELFLQAGYLSPQPLGNESERSQKAGHLDPFVASMLAKEPEEVQRVVVAILTIMKSMAKEMNKKC